MSVNLPQEAHVRLVLHRFRGCSDAHRDRYHEECPNCILLETNDGRCEEATHQRDAAGKCITCELFDTRVAGGNDSRVLAWLTKLKG